MFFKYDFFYWILQIFKIVILQIFKIGILKIFKIGTLQNKNDHLTTISPLQYQSNDQSRTFFFFYFLWNVCLSLHQYNIISSNITVSRWECYTGPLAAMSGLCVFIHRLSFLKDNFAISETVRLAERRVFCQSCRQFLLSNRQFVCQPVGLSDCLFEF